MQKVVIVEDEALVRKGIALAVDWAGVGCVVVGEAANGEEGLAVIRAQKPDLIVTDIKMPVLGGIEMVQTLRAEGNAAQVIFLTAYSDFAYAQAAVKLGASDYLLKPFHDGELEEAVLRLRAREASAAPALIGPELAEGPKSKYVAEALRYLAAHYENPDLTVGTAAAALGISEGHLSHIFKKETGSTPGNYLTRIRMRAAMELLCDYRSKIYEVADRVGYRDIAHFSATFKRAVGMTPSEYQKNANRQRRAPSPAEGG